MATSVAHLGKGIRKLRNGCPDWTETGVRKPPKSANKGFSTRTLGYPSWNLLWGVVSYGKAGRAHHKRGAYEARRWTSHHLSGDALTGGVREPNSPRSSDNSHTGSGSPSQDRFVGR